MAEWSAMNTLCLSSISFGELQISNGTVAFMLFLTLSTFVAVGLSSAQIIKFGSDEEE